jgi:hypothetical protein
MRMKAGLSMAAGSELSRQSDLTGYWSGEYWYDATVSPTPFSAHIDDTAGAITGSTLEPATFGAPGLTELSAELRGGHSGPNVYFTKVYHPAPGVHRDPIHYSGISNDKFTQIEGDWRFPDGFSGRFVMYRASFGAKAAVAKRKKAIVLKR